MRTLHPDEQALVDAARALLDDPNDHNAAVRCSAALRPYTPKALETSKCLDFVTAQLSGGYAAQHMETAVKFLASEIDRIREALSTEEE